MEKQTPVTVLTGFLGAGKTTLLNRILSEDHGKKYAVIVNEFGEMGIDEDLVINTDEEIFEMNNGCICCTVRGDLIRIINGLMKRKGKFDGIIIETTGLANPAPVIQTFFADRDVKEATKLDSVVTVVDAHHFLDSIQKNKEVEEQIAFADIILLNKADLVERDDLKKIEEKIKSINSYAPIHHTVKGNVELNKILGKFAFDLKRTLENEPNFLEEHEHHHDHHHHEHDNEVKSFSLMVEKPLNLNNFNHWIRNLLSVKGQDILRAKGILNVQGLDKKYVMQAVHMILDDDMIGEWQKNEKRLSRLVFIGRNLDRKEIEEGFKSCAA